MATLLEKPYRSDSYIIVGYHQRYAIASCMPVWCHARMVTCCNMSMSRSAVCEERGAMMLHPRKLAIQSVYA